MEDDGKTFYWKKGDHERMEWNGENGCAFAYF